MHQKLSLYVSNANQELEDQKKANEQIVKNQLSDKLKSLIK